ncbi:MAG: CHRD domain-containing protein [Chitinophagaceae bacterium]
MKLLKLTAVLSLLIVSLFSIISCEKEEEKKKANFFIKNDILLSGSQENPAVVTSAVGHMDVWYDKRVRILNYVVSWSGLSTNPTGFHIHGTAPVGFNASVQQNFSLTGLGKSGTYSGTLLIDGVKFKESDLLSGLFYVNMHTTTNPSGEIRGQITFQ